MLGDFEKGWAEYEWRCKNAAGARPQEFPQPRWDGKDLGGKTILLHAEQGFGDTLQFARYAPLVAARGGRVLFYCQTELARLMKSLPGVAELVPKDLPIPPFDVHCPLLSLPLAFGTLLDSVPGGVPYLSPDPALAEAWAQKLAAAGEGFRVGLVWAGTPEHKNDRNRSIGLTRTGAARRGGRRARFFSLQKGSPADQQATPPAGLQLTDVGLELTDFADTAAAMLNLDLVITVDTAIAHLAGAWQAGVGAGPLRPRLALDAGSRRQPLVPHDAAVPPDRPGRLGRRDGAAWPRL